MFADVAINFGWYFSLIVKVFMLVTNFDSQKKLFTVDAAVNAAVFINSVNSMHISSDQLQCFDLSTYFVTKSFFFLYDENGYS